MFAFIITVHVVVSVFLIFVILLQPGKGAGMAAFSGGGGGASTTAFGGRGSVTFLSKVTTVCAIVFMLTSLTLAWRSSHSDSVLRARRNLAAQDAKKPDTKPALPGAGSVPAPVTGGAALPAQDSSAPAGNSTPATPAPAAAKGPAAPATPSKK